MPHKPPNLGSAGMRSASTDPFDLWLSRGLHSLYSAVTAEPIPPELLRLIDGLSEGAKARATGPPVPRKRWSAMPGRQQGFEQRVRERAYFLWLEEGHPWNRAEEHWRLASAIQTAHEAGDDEWVGTIAKAS